MGSEPNIATQTSDPRTSAEIERDIQKTRGQMDQTLERLNERLSPRAILNDVLSWFESRDHHSAERLQEGYRSFAAYVREHPLPSLVAGTGLVWLLLESTATRREPEYQEEWTTRIDPNYTPPGAVIVEGEEDLSSTSRVSGAVETGRQKLADLGGSAKAAGESMKETARETLQRSRQASRRMGRRLRERADLSGQKFQSAVDEYPLGVGLGFLGLGLLVGLTLPRTRQEDEWMGTESDRFAAMAREKGQEVIERGKTVAERVAGRISEEAEKEGLTPEQLAEEARRSE